jgi:hypothetical protein
VVYSQSVDLGAKPPETHSQNFLFSQLNTCGHCPYITSSLMRGWVCNLQLLLAFISTFILGSETCGTGEHILLSQIRDFPFCRLLRLAELWWRYSSPPPQGSNIQLKVKVKVKVKVTLRLMLSQSVSRLMTRYTDFLHSTYQISYPFSLA